MIPIKNKKKTLKITIEEMRNLSLSYVEKYSPSRQQIKTYLLKKYLKQHLSSVKKKDIILEREIGTNTDELKFGINFTENVNSLTLTKNKKKTSVKKFERQTLSLERFFTEIEGPFSSFVFDFR